MKVPTYTLTRKRAKGLSISRNRGNKMAKSIWGKLSGHIRRALVEMTFLRYKKMFGKCVFSRTQERIVLENRLKYLLLNQ